VFYGDPEPVWRWGRRGYLSVEMETATLFLLAMRERAKGRMVRAGSILTVSDVLFDPDDPESASRSGGKAFYRPPEAEVNRRVDLTIGAALAAAAALGRGGS
jgi:uridine phosphorylase